MRPETVILQILQIEGSMPLEQLLAELRTRHFENEAEIKAGIWRLISESAVTLTSDNALSTTQKYQAA